MSKNNMNMFSSKLQSSVFFSLNSVTVSFLLRHHQHITDHSLNSNSIQCIEFSWRIVKNAAPNLNCELHFYGLKWLKEKNDSNRKEPPESSPNRQESGYVVNVWQCDTVACYERIMKSIIILCDRNACRIWFEVNESKSKWKSNKNDGNIIIFQFGWIQHRVHNLNIEQENYNVLHWSIRNNDDNFANWQTQINMISAQ